MSRTFVILITWQMHKDIQELREAVNPDILPKEYGGEVPLSEMIGTMIFPIIFHFTNTIMDKLKWGNNRINFYQIYIK